jgi:conjugal transfer pilus assembly protein TrbC
VHNRFKDTLSFGQTLVQQSGLGFSINPQLFQRFDVQAVPTVVLSDGQSFDNITGLVSLRHALERFAAEGDCSAKAKALLECVT